MIQLGIAVWVIILSVLLLGWKLFFIIYGGAFLLGFLGAWRDSKKKRANR